MLEVKIGIQKETKKILVYFPYNKEFVETIQLLPCREFDKKIKMWKIPLIDFPILRDILTPSINCGNIKVSVRDEVLQEYFNYIKDLKKIKSITSKTNTDFIIDVLKDGVTLYPFQKVAVEFLYEVKRGLLALDIGTGKSLVSITSSSILLNKNKIKNVLIICPATLKYNWAYEIAKFTNHSYNIISDNKNIRTEKYEIDCDYTILNYDLLRFDNEIIKNKKWGLIIADEVQRIKNYKAITTKEIKKIKSEYFYALSGTPMEKSVMDLFTVMSTVNKCMFGNNGKSFSDRYQEKFGYQVLGPKNLHEIDRKMEFCMMRREKRDVLDDLPEIIPIQYDIELTKEERKIYNKFKKEALDDDNNIGILASIVKCREAADCINLVENGLEKIKSSKLEELNNILEEVCDRKKIVIFTQYEEMAKIIENNIKFKSVHLHGGIKNNCKMENKIEKDIKNEYKDKISKSELDIKIFDEKNKCACKNCPYFKDDIECYTRKKIIQLFKEDNDKRVFITTDAGSTGMNGLQEVSDTIILFEKSFSYALNEQRIGRLDRIGQKSDKLTLITFITKDTIEERVEELLKQKKELFERVINRSDLDEKIVMEEIGPKKLSELL
jgi:SNF2 family DNA or RNA helicase